MYVLSSIGLQPCVWSSPWSAMQVHRNQTNTAWKRMRLWLPVVAMCSPTCPARSQESLPFILFSIETKSNQHERRCAQLRCAQNPAQQSLPFLWSAFSISAKARMIPRLPLLPLRSEAFRHGHQLTHKSISALRCVPSAAWDIWKVVRLSLKKGLCE